MIYHSHIEKKDIMAIVDSSNKIPVPCTLSQYYGSHQENSSYNYCYKQTIKINETQR